VATFGSHGNEPSTNYSWCSSRIHSWPIIVPDLYYRLTQSLTPNAFPILFADTSIIVTDSNIVDFQFHIKGAFEQLNNWFDVHLLS
jgi:hypothetical protein